MDNRMRQVRQGLSRTLAPETLTSLLSESLLSLRPTASCCPGSPALLAAPPAFFGSSILRLLSLNLPLLGFVLIIQEPGRMARARGSFQSAASELQLGVNKFLLGKLFKSMVWFSYNPPVTTLVFKPVKELSSWCQTPGPE